jgi:hypothetical protein
VAVDTGPTSRRGRLLAHSVLQPASDRRQCIADQHERSGTSRDSLTRSPDLSLPLRSNRTVSCHLLRRAPLAHRHSYCDSYKGLNAAFVGAASGATSTFEAVFI